MHFLILLFDFESAHLFLPLLLFTLFRGLLSVILRIRLRMLAHGVDYLGAAEEGTHFALKVHILVTPDGFEILNALGVQLEDAHHHILWDNLVELYLDLAVQKFLGKIVGQGNFAKYFRHPLQINNG